MKTNSVGRRAGTMTTRISNAFAKARAENRGVLGVFVTAGDPDADTSARILDALVDVNVDMVELGMPFSDPMADGPAIQAASLRALKNGMTLAGTLEIAAAFRKRHPDTPLILMGYYNPIYIYGNDKFLKIVKNITSKGFVRSNYEEKLVDLTDVRLNLKTKN